MVAPSELAGRLSRLVFCALQDLFFEIQRKKTHIYCDVKESCPVLELKKIIEGILKAISHPSFDPFACCRCRCRSRC
jgi:hypothetical protein